MEEIDAKEQTTPHILRWEGRLTSIVALFRTLPVRLVVRRYVVLPVGVVVGKEGVRSAVFLILDRRHLPAHNAKLGEREHLNLRLRNQLVGFLLFTQKIRLADWQAITMGHTSSLPTSPISLITNASEGCSDETTLRMGLVSSMNLQ